MQLIVMAAVLAMAGAGVGARQACTSRCHPTRVPITVEGCGIEKEIYTTICVGQCHFEYPFSPEYDVMPKERICNGDWSYEATHIEGCQAAVTYPVASNCRCKMCNGEYTSCKSYYDDLTSCLSF
ncbi:hypothetical protein PBY51_019278 [Eleginops maclovinus]|uniref:Glycoprotein hormone subunit beta domain-containing protein n=1 Tax=Eleginops maclovinus TaxID=56733 RepID=A0AAN7Y272_ELEMC|nr:hypothetical protein PBY51_019278 [Eleginops maclovinus]